MGFRKDRAPISATRLAVVSLGLFLFLVIIILPISSLFRYAFKDGIMDFFRAVVTDQALTALGNSLMIAAIVTLINLLTGTLMAFALVRYRFPGSFIIKALVDLPIAIPASVVGLSLLMLYNPSSLFGGFLRDNGIQLIGQYPGVLLGHLFVTFPFMVRSVSVAVEKLDREQEDAAKVLGAGGVSIFFRVTLPSIRSGLMAGSALTFTRSLGEFGATLFVAAGMLSTGPTHIYKMTEGLLDFQAAASIAVVLLLIPFVLLLIMDRLVKGLEVPG